MVCEKYEVLKSGGDCIHYDAEVYTLGTAEFCRWFHKLLYNPKDKECPHRPIYSDEVCLSTPKVKSNCYYCINNRDDEECTLFNYPIPTDGECDSFEFDTGIQSSASKEIS